MTLLEALTASPLTKKALAEKCATSPRNIEEAVMEARLRGVPIVSDGDGYRYAQTAEEVRQCADRLRRRAINQLLTARGLRRAARSLERTEMTLPW